ncbi:MAG: phage tail sheath family protein [Propionibacteriaceae bacterium]
MPIYNVPGVYVEEVPSGVRPIAAQSTSTPVFIGTGGKAGAPHGEPVSITTWTEYANTFLGEGPMTPLSHAVNGFFLNTQGRCYVLDIGDGALTGTATSPGLSVLEPIDDIAIVAAPGYTDPASYEAVIAHCEKMRDRVAILDAVPDGKDPMGYTRVATEAAPAAAPADGDAPPAGRRSAAVEAYRPRSSDFAAVYHPWLTVKDLVTGESVAAPPSGYMAGVWARTDASRGVFKAPANTPIRGVIGVQRRIAPQEQGELNDAGVNVIRVVGRGDILPWGARMLSSDAQWRYINVRRLFCMVEEAIADGTQWIVFEPNDKPLWNMIKRDVTAFLLGLWRDGALAGSKPEEAFFVKCDAETNPADVVDAGRVVAWVGLAPVKPAEFIVFQVSQFSGGTTTEELTNA